MSYKYCPDLIDCDSCRFKGGDTQGPCQNLKFDYLDIACKDCLLQISCNEICSIRLKEFIDQG